MATYSMRLKEIPFEKIKNQQKTIEIRLNDQKRQKLNVGDTIVFSNLRDSQDTIETKVIALYHYKTFKELVYNNPMKKFGYPKEYNKDDFTESIYNIYSKEDENKFGVLGIEIKLKEWFIHLS